MSNDHKGTGQKYSVNKKHFDSCCSTYNDESTENTFNRNTDVRLVWEERNVILRVNKY